MVRLNKNRLTPTQLRQLTQQLEGVIGKISANQSEGFLQDLLGHEERIMLAKRLAIIVLILEKQSLYKISNALKVSPATADKVKRKLDQGDYENIIAILGKDKKNYLAILETIDSILHLGGILPHYNGLDRYKYLN